MKVLKFLQIHGLSVAVFGCLAVEEFHRFYVLFYRVCQEGAVDWRGDCARLGHFRPKCSPARAAAKRRFPSGM